MNLNISQIVGNLTLAPRVYTSLEGVGFYVLQREEAGEGGGGGRQPDELLPRGPVCRELLAAHTSGRGGASDGGGGGGAK